MRGWIVGVSLLAVGTIGCADSVKLENQSREHTLRADAASRARDYELASREQSEAEKLHAKAVKKAYKEGRTDEVVVPADVPAPPTPKGLPPPEVQPPRPDIAPVP